MSVVASVAMRLTVVAACGLAAMVASYAQVPNDDALPPTVAPWFDRGEVPTWENDPHFQKDVFTFCRVYFDSYYGRGRGAKCLTDYPDSDLNFSLRPPTVDDHQGGSSANRAAADRSANL